MRWFLMGLVVSVVLFSYWLAHSSPPCKKTRWWTYYETRDIAGTHQVAMLQSSQHYWVNGEVVLPTLTVGVRNNRYREVSFTPHVPVWKGHGLTKVRWLCDNQKPITEYWRVEGPRLISITPEVIMNALINCKKLTITYSPDKKMTLPIDFSVCTNQK